MIEIKNVCYSYSNNQDLQISNISVKIESSETIGVVGKTGSGKSTLAKLISGIISPSSGKIYIDGVEIGKIKNLYSKLGIVFQYPERQLFSTSVYEDISFGAKNQGKSREQVDSIVKRLSEIFEIPEKILNSSPFDISGGERRKCAIAGVLAMEPSILILDEPMTGLDTLFKEKLTNYLEVYKRENGITVILISHDMNDIVRMSDKIIIMDCGEMKLFDVPENIFSDKNNIEIFGLELPRMRKIFKILNKEKSCIKGDILSYEEAKEELCKNIKVGRDKT